MCTLPSMPKDTGKELPKLTYVVFVDEEVDNEGLQVFAESVAFCGPYVYQLDTNTDFGFVVSEVKLSPREAEQASYEWVMFSDPKMKDLCDGKPYEFDTRRFWYGAVADEDAVFFDYRDM